MRKKPIFSKKKILVHFIMSISNTLNLRSISISKTSKINHIPREEIKLSI